MAAASLELELCAETEIGKLVIKQAITIAQDRLMFTLLTMALYRGGDPFGSSTLEISAR